MSSRVHSESIVPAAKIMKVNVNVLQAAVDENSRLVQWYVTPPVSKFFRKLYDESAEKADESTLSNKESEDLIIFQRQLKLVPKWNQATIDEIAALLIKWFANQDFKLSQSIKSVVVGRTMLMVAIGSGATAEVDERVRVNIPKVETYLHRVLVLVAEALYDYPSIMRINARDTEQEAREKKWLLKQIVHEALINAITDRLASPAVLTYMDSLMTATSLDQGVLSFNAEDEPDEIDEPEEEEGDAEGDAAAEAEIDALAETFDSGAAVTADTTADEGDADYAPGDDDADLADTFD